MLPLTAKLCGHSLNHVLLARAAREEVASWSSVVSDFGRSATCSDRVPLLALASSLGSEDLHEPVATRRVWIQDRCPRQKTQSAQDHECQRCANMVSLTFAAQGLHDLCSLARACRQMSDSCKSLADLLAGATAATR